MGRSVESSPAVAVDTLQTRPIGRLLPANVGDLPHSPQHCGVAHGRHVAVAVDNLQTGTMVPVLLPTSEGQIRPLTGYNDHPALQREIGRAAVTMDNLQTGTMVPLLPTSERQVRPLTGYNDQPELQREIWRAAAVLFHSFIGSTPSRSSPGFSPLP